MTATKARSVRTALQDCGIDAALITAPEAVFFFTGFQSSNAFYLVTATREVLITDGRYLDAANRHFAGTTAEVMALPAAAGWQTLMAGLGVRTLGIHHGQVTVAQFERYRRELGVQLKDFSVQENILRMQKTAEEVAGIRHACELADKALLSVLPQLKGGISEVEFAWLLEKAGRELGAEAVSFAPIVAFGTNSAAPHHHPGAAVLRPDMPVLIDWGFVVSGFASDCTRSFYYGQPDSEWCAGYEKVLAAQMAGIGQMRAGNPVGAPQIAAEKILGEKMVHGFGHGIGVEVHEFPHASSRGSGVFLSGSTVTAEPGLYFEGKFGIRIEDVIAISAGEPEILTGLPKTSATAILPA
jgi:Xaa-Pro aminopeptidase